MRMRPDRTFSGIYEIVNTVTGEGYIGRTINIDKRRKGHFRQLSAGTHPNHRLQASYQAHGAAAFAFNVLCRDAGFNELCAMEAEMLGRLRPAFNLAGPHLPGARKGKPYPGGYVRGNGLLRKFNGLESKGMK